MSLRLVKCQSSELQRCAEEICKNDRRVISWAKKYEAVTGSTPQVLQERRNENEPGPIAVATNSNLVKMPHHKKQYSAPGLPSSPFPENAA